MIGARDRDARGPDAGSPPKIKSVSPFMSDKQWGKSPREGFIQEYLHVMSGDPSLTQGRPQHSTAEASKG